MSNFYIIAGIIFSFWLAGATQALPVLLITLFLVGVLLNRIIPFW